MLHGAYPQHPQGWRSAIQDGIGVGGAEGQEAYQAGQCPYDSGGLYEEEQSTVCPWRAKRQ